MLKDCLLIKENVSPCLLQHSKKNKFASDVYTEVQCYLGPGVRYEWIHSKLSKGYHHCKSGQGPSNTKQRLGLLQLHPKQQQSEVCHELRASKNSEEFYLTESLQQPHEMWDKLVIITTYGLGKWGLVLKELHLVPITPAPPKASAWQSVAQSHIPGSLLVTLTFHCSTDTPKFSLEPHVSHKLLYCYSCTPYVLQQDK